MINQKGKVIETIKNGCVETLELHDGSEYKKRHIKTTYGSQCENKEFAKQMEADGIFEEIIEKVYDVYDGFLPSEFMDIAELDC
ncbi:hypothetical protein [Lacrimispora sp.]|uniref:hypothetical protein n=1 Tax=Lacrimispora sp. TaxID=2719234 RepID=UPI0028A58F23|nr:hypothetical protein [Lacrimispora sp.]